MKFTPEKLLERITVTPDGGALKTVYPHFIASKYDLEITVKKISGRYYVSEGGCVVRYLKQRGLYPDFEKKRNTLEKLFGFVLSGEELHRGYTRENKGYFDFIKNLIFILNLDIILPYLDTDIRYGTDDFLPPRTGECEDISGYSDKIGLEIIPRDDGFLISSGICYSGSEESRSAVFLAECGDGGIYIGDGQTHFDYRREVLEPIKNCDGFSKYSEITGKICERYALTLKDREIFMKSKANTEVLLNNYFRFLQGAVLLSEVGDGGMIEKC